MDSNSNSFDSFLPKTEADSDRDSRAPRLAWNQGMTKKLIETLGTECPVLWNQNHSAYKNKAARQEKMEYLADLFGTTTEEISRKLHNLRSQYNNELRKLKKRQDAGQDRSGGGSGWEYFELMSFLREDTTMNASLNYMNDSMMADPLGVDGVNIELAEFQAEEEQAFGLARARAERASSDNSNGSPGRKKPTLRVAASAPPPMPARALPRMWPDQPSIQPSLNVDESQVFGDFVASELRTLRPESRRKLKRIIQKAILQIGDEEDVSIIGS